MRKRKKRKGRQGRREEVSERRRRRRKEARRSRRRDNGNLAKDRLYNFNSSYPTQTDTSSSSTSRPESFAAAAAAATPRPDCIVCKHPSSSPSYNAPPPPSPLPLVCKSNVLFPRRVCVLRPERSTVGSARWTPGLIQHPVCRRRALTRLSGEQTGNGSLGFATLTHAAWDKQQGCRQWLLSSPERWTCLMRNTGKRNGVEFFFCSGCFQPLICFQQLAKFCSN